MDKRTKNVNIFMDSVELMQESSRLQQAIKESVKNQRLYLETAEVAVPESKGFSCKTVVSTKRSFEAASAYARAGKKVAVLNFASSTNPGGGVTHRLCIKLSDMGVSIVQKKEMYVRRHIVGGANRTLLSMNLPLRLCCIGTCRRLLAGGPQIVVALFERQPVLLLK